MLRILILFFCCLSGLSSYSQQVRYQLSMPQPETHYFEVEMEISAYPGSELEVKMPVWAPGSYLVREFSRNVNIVKAFDGNNKPLAVEKQSKNTWKISKGNAKIVRVKYEVYAFELSVRTSFLDATHGFVSGSGVFMYVSDWKEKPGELHVIPNERFKKVTTSLEKMKEQVAKDGVLFQFKNYDELADCPIEIGNHEEFEFTASGVKHTVAMYGSGNYVIDDLKRDMAKVVEAATAVFGENPNKHYVFIIHNVTNGQGGLEHMNSTTLSVNRFTYQGSAYLDFLSLVAHEYFHLWNVKRLRPASLGPFNYDEENYTSLLWVMEGFTSYYDELLLVRSGHMSGEKMVQKLNSSLNYVEGSVGSRVQPVAHASFDAWIKAYRPNENSANTTMTYYTRGSLLAALMDAQIIERFDGKKCLDHFLQSLYSTYYKKHNRGFTEAEFEKAYADFMGKDMSSFFRNFVYDTKVPDYKAAFAAIGVDVNYTGVEAASFGAGFSSQGGKVVVKSIRAGSAAERFGLSVNDEVIGMNGYRVTQSEVERMINELNSGNAFRLLIARDEVLMELNCVQGSYERPQYRLSLNSNPKTQKLQNYWLRSQP